MFKINILHKRIIPVIIKQNCLNVTRDYMCITSKAITSCKYQHTNSTFQPSSSYQQPPKAFMSTQPSSSSNNKFWYWVLGGSLTIGLGLTLLNNFSEKDIFKKSISTEETVRKKKIFVDLPEQVPYLIIGTGAAAHAASRAIRSKEVFAKVLMVGDEMHLPYMRPPLTKELWYQDDKDKVDNLVFKTHGGKERTVFFEKEGYFFEPKELNSLEHGGTAVGMGLKASKIDVESQTVHFDNGQKIIYDKCLIATGGHPKNLEIFKNAPKELSDRVMLFRTIEDFKKLYDLTKKVESIVIIGGGFLGSELACALGKRALELKSFKVVQIFPESGNLGQVLPEYLSRFATEKVKEEGARVLSERKVKEARFEKRIKKAVLTLDDDSEISADHIIVAVGLDPNIELAKASDLEVDPNLGGFLVNAELEARTNLWVAGDAACFYDARLGRRRVEHHDHAVVSGRLAGLNMTGSKKPYWHQSMIWSDLGPSIGFEAIGLIDSTLPTVSVFAKVPNLLKVGSKIQHGGDNKDEKTEQQTTQTLTTPVENNDNLTLVETSSKIRSLDDEDYGKGLVFYLRDDVVVGILMWNVFSGMGIARQILKEGRKFDDYSEVAKLFHLFYKPMNEDGEKDKKEKEDEPSKPKSKKQIGEGAGFYVGR